MTTPQIKEEHKSQKVGVVKVVIEKLCCLAVTEEEEEVVETAEALLRRALEREVLVASTSNLDKLVALVERSELDIFYYLSIFFCREGREAVDFRRHSECLSHKWFQDPRGTKTA